MQFRQLSVDDLDAIVAIHLLAFPRSAMSSLGAAAVRRYYHWLLTGPHDRAALGACAGGRPQGFCFAGRFNGATSGFLHKNRLYLLMRLLSHPWLALNPLVRKRAVVAARTLVCPSEPDKVLTARAAQDRSSFGILAIGVDPQNQGTGIGRGLMNEAERIAVARGFAFMNLTVHPNNLRAIRFYESMGWVRVERDGRWQGEMVRVLSAPTRASRDA